VATAVGNDPENTTISYSLSGGGDKFTIDNNGQITLTDNLDYENNTTYELTVFASDGFFSVPKIITVTITDANDAPSLSSSVAFNSFLGWFNHRNFNFFGSRKRYTFLFIIRNRQR
jgi:VCBS repeat-containing protein